MTTAEGQEAQEDEHIDFDNFVRMLRVGSVDCLENFDRRLVSNAPEEGE